MNRLRQAAQVGDTIELYYGILEEADVLRGIDEAEFIDTPLLIAANGGHANFAMAMIEMVLDLLSVDKDLVRVKGKEGYTALHYAAEKGDLDLLAQFLNDCPA
ncbi:hypothetical protein CRYUN_Cryun41cG0048200 [Craigia yunnanensis]